MNAQSQQEPAVTCVLVKGNPNTLVVVIGNLKVLLLLGVSSEILDDSLAAGTEVLVCDLYPDLLALYRFLEVSDKAFELLALHAELSELYDDPCDEVSAVVKEVIVLHGSMA